MMDMPMSFHAFDMWMWLILSAAILIPIVAVIVLLLTRQNQRMPPNAVPSPSHIVENAPVTTFTEKEDRTVIRGAQLRKAVELVRPTLTHDERLILNEIVKAGGEILQSDLPEKSDFSKATVSKLIKSLETMGVIIREKHKWTYWVRLSDKLISRTKNR